MHSCNSRAVVSNNVLSSFGRSTVQDDVVNAEAFSTDPSSRSVDESTDLTADVAPSAVVSGGMVTLPTQYRNVNGEGGATVSPWQRGPLPTGAGRALTRGSCSYGASSPCCKLLPATTTASSSHAPSSCHLRSVTLPRGHPAMYSGEVAARLRPPPPPSAAAVRQAAQRAGLAGPPTSKTLDVRPRSHGRAGGAFKTSTDSNTEQRRSVSTVIV